MSPIQLYLGSNMDGYEEHTVTVTLTMTERDAKALCPIKGVRGPYFWLKGLGVVDYPADVVKIGTLPDEEAD